MDDGRADKTTLCSIAAMDATVAATIPTFFRVNPLAGAMLIPYICWGAYATALNYRIMVDNPNASQIGKKEGEQPILEASD